MLGERDCDTAHLHSFPPARLHTQRSQQSYECNDAVGNRQELSSMEQTMDLDWVSAALRLHWPVTAELFESDSEGMSNVVDAFILFSP